MISANQNRAKQALRHSFCVMMKPGYLHTKLSGSEIEKGKKRDDLMEHQR